jgi:DnaJ like chaperone protein
MAVVGLAAKMAKADGVAVAVEAAAFERCFRVPPVEMANARRLFALAAKDVAGYDAYAQRIARMLGNDRVRLQQVIECLYHIASADHLMHPAEEHFLDDVSTIFGFSDEERYSTRAMFVHDPESPYAVLGIKPEVDDETLRAGYMRLVKDNHPDRLTATGAPKEVVAMADRKLAAINAAYDRIVASRRSRTAKGGNR